jgi:hypothetical protein
MAEGMIDEASGSLLVVRRLESCLDMRFPSDVWTSRLSIPKVYFDIHQTQSSELATILLVFTPHLSYENGQFIESDAKRHDRNIEYNRDHRICAMKVEGAS